MVSNNIHLPLQLLAHQTWVSKILLLRVPQPLDKTQDKGIKVEVNWKPFPRRLALRELLLGYGL